MSPVAGVYEAAVAPAMSVPLGLVHRPRPLPRSLSERSPSGSDASSSLTPTHRPAAAGQSSFTDPASSTFVTLTTTSVEPPEALTVTL